MERILLIEDDQALGRGTALALAGEGREIRVAATLAQGWAALSEGEYALVLLDLNLPDGNGLDFLTALRRTSGVPVLILTANDLESDQVAGLELGADDYVTKPFSMPVLLEKIRVILRRSGEAAESRLHYRDLVVDLDTREAALDGRPLDLTAREFELLRTFLAAPGRVFTREMLLSRLWGYDFFGDERVVDSHIKNLRHKLGRDYIETVRGVGYRAAKETR